MICQVHHETRRRRKRSLNEFKDGQQQDSSQLKVHRSERTPQGMSHKIDAVLHGQEEAAL